MTLRLWFSPEAQEQLSTIQSWWQENRSAVPDMFADEFEAAVRLLVVRRALVSLIVASVVLRLDTAVAS